jgi:hypothetical protein
LPEQGRDQGLAHRALVAGKQNDAPVIGTIVRGDQPQVAPSSRWTAFGGRCGFYDAKPGFS